MDFDERLTIDSAHESQAWLDIFQVYHASGRLAQWISTFHLDKLPCEIVGDFASGNYSTTFNSPLIGIPNLACKATFSNNEAWLVHFCIGDKVKLSDEKVAAEVATIGVIRKHTEIPVPEVKAWGIAADNELGLGPFIMFSFLEGVSLGAVLQNPVKGERMMREDVSGETIRTIYRQIARFMLQLSKLDFDRIGSLSPTSGESAKDDDVITVQSRPFTSKAHEILNVGGVDVFPPPTTTFPSTTEYFDHVIEKDLHHLRTQLNSVDEKDDARKKYIYWNIARKLVQRFTSARHDNGPFKLICDGFTPMNLLVNNTTDLQIVAVVDWAWSYTGPQELFWAPPSWLCIESPNTWEAEQYPERTERYMKYLDIWTRAVEEQEDEILGGGVEEKDRPSTIMKLARKGGAMWFYALVREGFNGPTCVPWEKLREELKDWRSLVAGIWRHKIDDFVSMKEKHVKLYDALLFEKHDWYDGLQRGEAKRKESEAKRREKDKEEEKWQREHEGEYNRVSLDDKDMV